jgi:hypothetical protein
VNVFGFLHSIEGASKSVNPYFERARYTYASQKFDVNGLLVVADAATEIVDLGNVAYLRNGRRVRAWLWKHVADLSDLAFLRRSVKVRPI